MSDAAVLRGLPQCRSAASGCVPAVEMTVSIDRVRAGGVVGSAGGGAIGQGLLGADTGPLLHNLSCC
jgi:hypothetical protein